MASDRPPSIPHERRRAKAAALEHLWCDVYGDWGDPKLFALLDAARDPGIYRKLRDFAATEDISCLYQGATAEELATVAPYLVRLGPLTDVFDWIWKQGWGRSWGIYCWSTSTSEELRAHFRKLTKVRTADGEVLLFRFYDPRVLSVFLPTCSKAQINEMFGPINRIFVETEEGRKLTEFTQSAGILSRRVLDLTREG